MKKHISKYPTDEYRCLNEDIFVTEAGSPTPAATKIVDAKSGISGVDPSIIGKIANLELGSGASGSSGVSEDPSFDEQQEDRTLQRMPSE